MRTWPRGNLAATNTIINIFGIGKGQRDTSNANIQLVPSVDDMIKRIRRKNTDMGLMQATLFTPDYGIKFLSINDIPPSSPNYPLIDSHIYLAYKEMTPLTDAVIKFFKSQEGIEVIKKTGYTQY
jgi:hypothetical protein